MWQYLFLGKAVGCPLEHKAYCRLYHICFGGREEYEEGIELTHGRQKLDRDERERIRKTEEQRKAVAEELRRAPGDRLSAQWGREIRNAEWKMRGRESAREKMRRWVEDELGVVREAIRVRKEVAVVRGAVESNCEGEGEGFYGDEVEVEDVQGILSLGASRTSAARAVGLATSVAFAVGGVLRAE